MEWDLPDHRLGIRAQLCMDRIRSNPGLSFPDIFSEPRELLWFYRFINNAHIDYNSLGATYFDKTKKQCRNKKDILVLQDITIVQPTRALNGLRYIYKSKDSKGFLCHLSLAVVRHGQRVIMGPCGIYNWTRKKIKASNEHLRWFEQVKNAEECFVAKQANHIMDREGDSFYNLCHLKKAGYRFVVTSCHDRVVSSGEKMLELITSTQVIASMTKTNKAEWGVFNNLLLNKDYVSTDGRENGLFRLFRSSSINPWTSHIAAFLDLFKFLLVVFVINIGTIDT